MRNVSLVSSLAAAALVLSAAPLAAQQASTTTEKPVRVVATYDFRKTPPTPAFPRLVTVTDSAGTIIARAELNDNRSSIPLTVTVIESDLVLQGETGDGVLTLVFEDQNDGGSNPMINGRWTLGRTEGVLRGMRPRTDRVVARR